MCAILDANVAHQLTSTDPDSPGRRFLDRVDSKSLSLVIGGLLREELYQTTLRDWLEEALVAGSIRTCDDEKVNLRTEEISNSGRCRSDDPHIIALAQISRARLLFTNDRKLKADFGDHQLVNNPRGRVYTTLRYQSFHRSHRDLLNRPDLCAGQ